MTFHWIKMLPIFILFEKVKGWNGSDPLAVPNITKLQALDMWRLEMQWEMNQNESKQAYEIQVGRSENMDVIDSMNISGGSSAIWISQLPLNCIQHSVRMRLIQDGSHAGAWSSWTTHYGDVADKEMLFPVRQVLREGSTVMLCWIFPTEKNISVMYFGNEKYPVINLSPRVKAIRVENITATTTYGVNFYWDPNATITYKNYVTFPPEKPQNLTCETQDMRNISCSWKTHRPANLSRRHQRKYTLLISDSREIPCPVEGVGLQSCSFKVIPRQINYNITLLVNNSLGRESKSDIFNITDRVFPAPVRLEATPGVFEALVLLHLNGSFNGLQLTCQLKLDPGGTTQLKETGSDSVQRFSFRLQHLKPSTKYSTRGRCAVQGNQWGRWINGSFLTKPLVTVNLWRRIREHPNRTVSLLWKTVSSDPGTYTEAYEVCVNNSDPQRSVCRNITQTQVDLTVDSHSCDISVRAIIQTGLSIPSHITIPSAYPHDQSNTSSQSTLKRIMGNETGFQLTWTRESAAMCDYVVEWCMLGIVPPCSLQWREVPANQTSLNLNAEHFKAGVQYMFTIYGCSAERNQPHEKQIGFFIEQEPTQHPSLDSDPDVTWSSINLKWTFNEMDPSHTGFITGYVVTVEDESETGSDLRSFSQSVNDPHRKSVTINGLEEDQMYTFHLAACSSVGCGPKTSATYRTTKNYYLLTAKIVVPLLVLLSCCVCLWSFRSVMRGFPEETFNFLHIKALDLDEDLYEASEKIRDLRIEDCKWCDVEILDVRPSVKDKTWLVNREDPSCSFIRPKIPLPSFLSTDMWSTTGVTNFTYVSSVAEDEPLEELETHATQQQPETAGFLSDYVTSVVT